MKTVEQYMKELAEAREIAKAKAPPHVKRAMEKVKREQEKEKQENAPEGQKPKD